MSANSRDKGEPLDFLPLPEEGVLLGLAAEPLRVSAMANGTQARLWDCKGDAGQQWNVNSGGSIPCRWHPGTGPTALR